MNTVRTIGLGAGIGGLIALGLTGYLWLSVPATPTGPSPQPGASPRMAEDREPSGFGPKAAAAPPAAKSRSPGVAGEQGGDSTVRSLSQGRVAPSLTEAPPPLFGNRASGDVVAPTPSTSSESILGGVAIGRNGAPSLNHIQGRLQALVAQGRQPTAREVDLVLADLQKNQGTDVVSGVNLQVMRNNLSHTDRIEQIAKEIQTIASNPATVDSPRISALVAQMQRHQAAIVSPMVSTVQR